MDIEFFRDYCLSKPLVTEETPFGPDTLVFKIHGKMYALSSLENFVSTNLKCDPEYATELRSKYLAIEPGFHMNKKHWNTVYFDRDMQDAEILKLIDHSYDLVYNTLPKKLKEKTN